LRKRPLPNRLERKQQEDPALGDIARLRRSRVEVPSQEELSKESDVTKKLCLQWGKLEVGNEVVYRRLPGSKLGEEVHVQLLVPKSGVEEVLRLCHAKTEVDGRMMAEVCKPFGITKLRTSPDKPSTNQVGRFHKTTNAILAKTVSEGQRDCDDQLPFVLAAYRATKHNSTVFIPNRLVLGKEVLAPIDLVYGGIDDEDQWRRQYELRRPILGHPNTNSTDS